MPPATLDLGSNCRRFYDALTEHRSVESSALYLLPAWTRAWADAQRLVAALPEAFHPWVPQAFGPEPQSLEPVPAELLRSLQLPEAEWRLLRLPGLGLLLLSLRPEAELEAVALFLEAWQATLSACLQHQRLDRAGRLRQQRQRRRLRGLLDSAVVGYYRCSPGGRLLAMNRTLAQLLGAEGAVSGLDYSAFFVLPERRQAFLQLLEERGEAHAFESELQLPDGRRIWVSESARALRNRHGRVRLIEGTVVDVSARRLVEDALAHQSLHDPLTGLANRSLLLDRLSMARRRAVREPQRAYALLLLDLDRLRLVNESLGHEAGDRLLRTVAQRLEAALRPGDSVARLGSDEFGILLEDCADEDCARAAAQRLLSAVDAAPDSGEPALSASGGLVLAGGDEEPEAVLRDAAAALRRAKSDGPGSLALFRAPMHDAAKRRLSLERGLRGAVQRGEIQAAYQPLVALPQGHLLGFEALARWQHPQLGQVPPDQFIAVAEDCGLIEGLGARILEIACARAQAWAAEAGPERSFFVSVNVSALQLKSERVVDLVAECMARHQLDGSRLKLELTESLLVEDPALGRRVLARLRELGPALWLDDFGSGYSSLGSLAEFPLQGVKLDRSFIRGLDQGPRGRAVLEGVLSLARRLDLQVVAEGIETPAQAELLGELGCPMGQGYLWSKPLPEAEARLRLLHDRLPAAPI